MEAACVGLIHQELRIWGESVSQMGNSLFHLGGWKTFLILLRDALAAE
jgi:hypothetical protein